MSAFVLSRARSGTGGVASCTLFLPVSASTPATAAQTTATISAASQASTAVASARIAQAVRAPSAYRPNTPAPPNMPAPMPAFLPFTCSSALASSISLRTSSVVCSDSRRIRSAIDSSEDAPFLVCGSIGLPPRARVYVLKGLPGRRQRKLCLRALSGGCAGAARRPRRAAHLVARGFEQLVERGPDRGAHLGHVRHRVVVREQAELD